MKRYTILGLVTAGVVGLLFATRPGPGDAPVEPPVASVEVVRVVRQDVRPVERVAGQLLPSRSARLQFEIAGRVTERRVEPGQPVRAGDLLLAIDAGDMADALVEARAARDSEREAVARDRRLLELADREIALLEQEVDRLGRLEKQSLASRSRHDQALAQLLRKRGEQARLRHGVATADARMRRAEAALRRAGRNLERARLRAPFDATVNAVVPDVGDHVRPGHMAVELVRLDELDLVVPVRGGVARALAPGQQVAIRVPDGPGPVSGRIVAIARSPDALTHTHTVRIRVPGDGLAPGQVARADLPERLLAQATVVPVEAVLYDEGKTYVFVVRDGMLERAPVTLVARVDDRQVVSGVQEGDLIVARDVAALTAGERVRTDAAGRSAPRAAAPSG